MVVLQSRDLWQVLLDGVEDNSHIYPATEFFVPHTYSIIDDELALVKHRNGFFASSFSTQDSTREILLTQRREAHHWWIGRQIELGDIYVAPQVFEQVNNSKFNDPDFVHSLQQKTYELDRDGYLVAHNSNGNLPREEVEHHRRTLRRYVSRRQLSEAGLELLSLAATDSENTTCTILTANGRLRDVAQQYAMEYDIDLETPNFWDVHRNL